MKTRNTMRLNFSIISCVLFLFLGCKDTSSTINPDDTTVNDSTFTDIRDYRKYTIVKIGKQVWMSENLQTSTYSNGDPVLYAPSKEEWEAAANKQQGAWCYFNGDEQNGKTFGKLYNCYAVIDSRGLAPKGYHIPTNAEWNILSNYLGGDSIAGKKMKSTSEWQRSLETGDNSSGFNGEGSGLRRQWGAFDYLYQFGLWWSSTKYDTNYVWHCNLVYYSVSVGRYHDFEKGVGLSVRCIKD
jgi:uncharacterized protein (TIGR02145 family)